MFHTISLTFTQANWTTLLGTARTTGLNVYGSLLTLDNGATNIGFGARYKGNTSYPMAGTKKSFNLEIDWPAANSNGHLMGVSTINLNNAFGDETIMREPVYFTLMRRYVTCPKAAMARVHVNGALWGVFSLAQQENGQLITDGITVVRVGFSLAQQENGQLISDWFPSNNGDRCRTPNAPVGGGFSGSNSALSLINGSTNLSTCLANYDLRTTNAPTTNAAWARLINAILDTLTFGPQTTEYSYGRSYADADVWVIMAPTPGQPNQ